MRSQFSAKYFAQKVSRQVRADDDLKQSRLLVFGQVLFAVGLQITNGKLLSRFDGDDRFDDFAPFAIGNPDHRHVGNSGTRTQHGLDLAGVDVKPRGDDQILLVDDAERTVLVLCGQIAGEQPTVADRPVASGSFQ